jgi:hypothetical protein
MFHGSVELLVQVSLALQNLFLCPLFFFKEFDLLDCVVFFKARVDVSDTDAAVNLLNLVWLGNSHSIAILIIDLADS